MGYIGFREGNKTFKARVFHQIWTPNPVPANGSQRPSAPRRFNSSLTSRNLFGKMTSTQISYAEYNMTWNEWNSICRLKKSKTCGILGVSYNMDMGKNMQFVNVSSTEIGQVGQTPSDFSGRWVKLCKLQSGTVRNQWTWANEEYLTYGQLWIIAPFLGWCWVATKSSIE